MTIEKIKDVLYETYEKVSDGADPVYTLMDDIGSDSEEYKNFLFKTKLEFVENNDKEAYDSYGSEDSILSRIFKHEETGTFFEFYGTRCSYQGEEWDGVREVVRKEIIKVIYE